MTAIITPIWKKEFNKSEEFNINYSLSKLINYDHIFVCEEELDITYYQSKFKNSSYVLFPKKTFSSISSYNRLMLSSKFYKKFMSYEYILILQSDAIIINDIKNIINLNVDFIGSNWKKNFKIPIFTKNRYLSYLLKKVGFYTNCKIGNGGLSLRKISKFIEITSFYNLTKYSWLNEDLIFSKFITENKISSLGYDKNYHFVEEIIFPEKLKDAIGFHAHDIYYPNLKKKLIEN